MDPVYTYEVLIDGKLRHFCGAAPNRGDMSFWGFSLRDIHPPHGYHVELDEITREPKFVLGRRVSGC
jgi:hypothetical protein